MRASESSDYEKAFDALHEALYRFITVSSQSAVGTPLYRPRSAQTEQECYLLLNIMLDAAITILNKKEF